MRQNMAIPSSVRKHPETFCCTDDSCADPSQPDCCQMAPQSRAQSATSPTCLQKADPADCEQDFASPVQVFAFPVPTSLGEGGSPGSPKPGSHHSDKANVRAPARRGRFGSTLWLVQPRLSSPGAGLSSCVPRFA